LSDFSSLIPSSSVIGIIEPGSTSPSSILKSLATVGASSLQDSRSSKFEKTSAVLPSANTWPSFSK